MKEIAPRAKKIRRSWASLSWPSVFSAIVYPSLGIVGLVLALALGLMLPSLHITWWHIPVALAAGTLTLFLCNQGIGPLHRIWQHKAGELRAPAQFLVGLNCILAMQGKIKDWVNYHAQHHRFSDRPGDPHNPAEGRFWAWIGWVLWRDPNDLKRPMVHWLRENRIIRFADRHHVPLSLLIHLVVPVLAYLMVLLIGSGFALALLVHASVVIARGIHFHATTIGVNVCGHMRVPKWVTWGLALLTGGEAFHAHHHAYPRSILHLPRKGMLNRLIDYNGTVLLLLGKLKLARNYHIAPQFA